MIICEADFFILRCKVKHYFPSDGILLEELCGMRKGLLCGKTPSAALCGLKAQQVHSPGQRPGCRVPRSCAL